MENTLIFKFSSSSMPGLFAFAGDQDGNSLPERHGPWNMLGKIQPKESVPHGLDRKIVDDAINEHGYQLWRMKKTEDAPPPARAEVNRPRKTARRSK